MKEIIKELCGMRAVSGYEHRINEKVKELFLQYTSDVRIDTLGNVIATKRSEKQNAKKILIEAHIDEIGLMVKNIDENGFITVANVGGVDPRILPSSEVVIHGKKDIKGVIGAKPPHIMSKDEGLKCAKLSDMAIDTGYSFDEIKNIVKVGDSVTLATFPTELLGTQITSKSLDDRASIAVLLNFLKEIQNVNLDYTVILVASVREELGGFGAMTASYTEYPDMAIAIDVCHGITPDNSYSAYEVGSGAVITCGPNIHPAIFDRLIKTAKENDIKYTVDVDGGNTGTDAWEMQVIREGIPTGLLSIPLKYMHTSVETIDTEDALAVSELILKFVLGLKSEEEWLCY